MERLRLGKNTVHTVRTLSESYKGLQIHWIKGASVWCQGKDVCRHHHEKLIWKGYCCVEDWNQAGNLWVPRVLEITESLDQDFRGVFRRGQIWELRYGKKRHDSKALGITGVLWEQVEDPHWPEPYDMQPVLDSTYGVIGVRLTQDNPMPPRLMVTASKGSPPIRPVEPAPPTERLSKEDMEKFRKAREGFAAPTE